MIKDGCGAPSSPSRRRAPRCSAGQSRGPPGLLPVFSLISHRTLNRAGFILWQFSACFLQNRQHKTHGLAPAIENMAPFCKKMLELPRCPAPCKAAGSQARAGWRPGGSGRGSGGSLARGGCKVPTIRGRGSEPGFDLGDKGRRERGGGAPLCCPARPGPLLGIASAVCKCPAMPCASVTACLQPFPCRYIAPDLLGGGEGGGRDFQTSPSLFCIYCDWKH